MELTKYQIEILKNIIEIENCTGIQCTTIGRVDCPLYDRNCDNGCNPSTRIERAVSLLKTTEMLNEIQLPPKESSYPKDMRVWYRDEDKEFAVTRPIHGEIIWNNHVYFVEDHPKEATPILWPFGEDIKKQWKSGYYWIKLEPDSDWTIAHYNSLNNIWDCYFKDELIKTEEIHMIVENPIHTPQS